MKCKLNLLHIKLSWAEAKVLYKHYKDNKEDGTASNKNARQASFYDENNKAEVKKAAALCSVSQFPGGNSSLSHCRYRDSFIWEMVTLLCYDNILTFTV